MKKVKVPLIRILLISFILVLPYCKKDNSSSTQTSQNGKATFTGYAQKGPFINGSSVTVYDLQSDLSPTGKTFNAQITDDKGTFQLTDIALTSDYVNLRADGFYYNEILGQPSAAQLTLYAISDIANKNEVNINLLTNLEKSRVEFLIKSGKSFTDSKTQAQKEILSIFNIDNTNVRPSECLNISENGDDDAKLLAVSCILQGYRSESELTELLADISNDITNDGILNNDSLGSDLINQAISIDTAGIKTNLQNHYNTLGSNTTIPGFGKYIANFISQTKFTVTQGVISYPATGINGTNVLALSKTVFSSGMNNTYSLAANLVQGTALTIRITSLTLADTIYNPATDSSKSTVNTIIRPAWYYFMGSGINWSISDFDFTNYIQTFTAIQSGQSCDLKLYFDKGSFLIEYFEMNATTPTRKKTITVN